MPENTIQLNEDLIKNDLKVLVHALEPRASQGLSFDILLRRHK